MTSLVIAATDGSAINNPHGPAGWAWFVSETCWAAGGFNKASNQHVELFAILALLRAVPREYPLLVRSDSQFAINVISKWMPGWKRPDGSWRKADGQEPTNLDVIRDLDRALAGRRVQFEWVRGHNGDAMNEVADRLCGAASDAIRRGRPVTRGPGWTGYQAAPVIPSVGRRPAAAPQPVRRPAATLVGERAVLPAGAGSNARVRRVTAATPSSPSRGKPVLCGSCDRPVNPLTFECGGCSG